MIRLRWVTWWPAPYWIDRFNALAKRRSVELEAVFLSSGVEIQEWQVAPQDWQFDFRILKHSRDRSSGYFRVAIENPWPGALTTGRYDCIVLHYASLKCMAAALVSGLKGKRVLFFVPNTLADARRQAGWKEATKRALFNRADALLTTGPLQTEYARQYLRGDRVKVFEIGNPTRDLSAGFERAVDSGASATTRIVYVGRLSPEKSIDVLLRAVSLCNASSCPVAIDVIGSGPDRPSLESLAARLGVDVTFHGFVQQDDLSEHLLRADIFVLPSASEPWGLVVNEAMDFELPIILSRNVGCRPVLLEEGVNGLSFAAGDHQELARQIQSIALDRNRMRQMGRESKRIVSAHSIEAWVDRVLAAIADTR